MSDSRISENALPELAEALRSLSVPPLSLAFDDSVLAALRVPLPWWRRVWQPVQPLLLGASGSFVLTLLLVHLALSGPQTAPTPLPPSSVSVQNLAAAPMPSLDALLDRPNLCAGSLASAWNSPSPLETDRDTPPKAPRRSEPRRRAEVGRRTALIC